MQKSSFLVFLLFFSFWGMNIVAAKTDTDTSKPVISPKIKDKRWLFLQAGLNINQNSGKWAERYASHTSVPIRLEYQHRNKFVAGIEHDIYLGSNVNTTNLYTGMTTEDGSLLDITGYPAIIRTYMRGFHTNVYGLKTIVLKRKNQTTWTLHAGAGIGYHYHYTKFVFDLDKLPQLEEENLGGYDRRSDGFQVSEKIRIQYFNYSSVSFVLGLDLTQGQNNLLRAYDFSTQTPRNNRSVDYGFGVNFGIIIPIKIGDNQIEPEYFTE